MSFQKPSSRGYLHLQVGDALLLQQMKKPGKTIPRCIFTVLPLVTIIYLLVNISYLTVLTPREILSSDAVAITWTGRVVPSLTWVIPSSISASLFSNLLINVFELSRVIHIAGPSGPAAFPALLLVTVTSFAKTNLLELINYLYFVISIWSVLLIIGILKLRYQEPNLPSPYKVFLPFPLVTMAISLCLVLIPLVKSSHMHYIYVCLSALGGLWLYLPLIHFKLKLVWFEKMTCYVQLLFNICIPDESSEE
ncbi:hypothetical protein MC885_008189, partial [Smutsia gigantea]